MRPSLRISLVLLVIMWSANLGTEAQAADYFEYVLCEDSMKGAYAEEEEPRAMEFRFDSNDVGHFFFAYPAGDLDDLHLVTYDGFEVVFRDVIASIPGAPAEFFSGRMPDGSISLFWTGTLPGTEGLYLLNVCDGTAASPVKITSETIEPAFEFTPDGEVHFAYLAGTNEIAYVRSIGGVFQAPIRHVIETGDPVASVDLAVAPGGLVHFLSYAGTRCVTYSFDGQAFSSLTDVTTLPVDPGESIARIIIDQDSKVYAFFESDYTRTSGDRKPQLYYTVGQSGHFASPVRINGNAKSLLWRDPLFDREGTLWIIGCFRHSSMSDDLLYGAFQQLRCSYLAGFGFGSPAIQGSPGSWLVPDSSPDPPCSFADVRADGSVCLALYRHYYVDPGSGLDEQDPDIRFRLFEKRRFNTPQLQLSCPWGTREGELETYLDVVPLHIGLYNPAPVPLRAELTIRLSYYDAFGPYWDRYLSASPFFPSFSANPTSIEIDLPPGASYQQVPLLEFDLSVLGPNWSPPFNLMFIGDLIDRDTGETLDHGFAQLYFEGG